MRKKTYEKGALVLVQVGTGDAVAQVLEHADGLVLVRRFVAKHGGWLGAKSVPERLVAGEAPAADPRTTAARAAIREEKAAVKKKAETKRARAENKQREAQRVEAFGTGDEPEDSE